MVQERIKNGNVWETGQRHGIAPKLLYRSKDEVEEGAKEALGEKRWRGRNREGPSHPEPGANAEAEISED